MKDFRYLLVELSPKGEYPIAGFNSPLLANDSKAAIELSKMHKHPLFVRDTEYRPNPILGEKVKPKINYAGEEAEYVKTYFEDSQGEWNWREAQRFCDTGCAVIHDGEAHHLYCAKKR